MSGKVRQMLQIDYHEITDAAAMLYSTVRVFEESLTLAAYARQQPQGGWLLAVLQIVT
jgi:hypothetical protein